MLEQMPPLNALRTFALVAEHGSLAAAAGRQNITQPAVSKRIRQLEEYLGVALLLRGANSVALTEAGRCYAARVTQALNDIRDATADMAQGGPHPLRIRCFTTWATRWLIPRLPGFGARHPGHEIEILTSVEPVDFARDRVDAAVCSGGEAMPRPGSGRLQAIRIAPFAAPAIATQLKQQGWAGVARLGSRNRPGDWSVWTQQACAPETEPVLMFETTALAIEVALRGMGVVIASRFMLQEEMQMGRLVQVGPTVETGSRYWLILPSGALHPGAILFRDWLVEQAGREEAASGANEF